LPIADCRLTIEKVVWQLLPMSISNRQSAIENRQSLDPQLIRAPVISKGRQDMPKAKKGARGKLVL
jgi:hypothetical protein